MRAVPSDVAARPEERAGRPSALWRPRVSLVVPCRDEAGGIAAVVDSLVAQDYPAELVELLFVDGGSVDSTRRVVERRSRAVSAPAIYVIDNPLGTAAAGFNVGILASRGEVVFTLGAHTRYSRNYVSGAVRALAETGADAVGSVAVTEPGAGTAGARAIARALCCRFGVGGSLMRVGVRGVREAETGSCPAYRASVFGRVGLFDERLVRNQDIELNMRLVRAGGRVVVDPRIVSFYRARSTVGALARSCFENGRWVVRSWLVCRARCRPRHLVPLAFVLGLALPLVVSPLWPRLALLSAAVAAAYALALVWFSGWAGRGSGGVVVRLPVVFAVMHLAYGVGSVRGFFDRVRG